MTGQGFLFKLMTAFSGCKSLLTNRVALGSYQHIAQFRSTSKEKLKELNIPEKPKKPLTAYFRFLVDHRPGVVEKNPHAKVMDIVAKCAEDWKHLDPATKEKYREQYKADMVQYTEKHLDYCALLTDEQKSVLKDVAKEKRTDKDNRKFKRAIKEAGKPKRPSGPFMFFVIEKRKELPKMSLQELLLTIKGDWQKLTPEKRQKYQDLYLDDKKRYELEMLAWEEKMINEGKINLVRQFSLIESQQKKRPIEPKNKG